MKDLGSCSHFLGITTTFTSAGVFLSQATYANTLLHRAGMLTCKPASSPLPLKLGASCPNDALFTSPELYRSLAGSLQYLTDTRPDISYVVNYLCQFMHSPKICHFQLLKRVLHYIKGTLNHSLHFKLGPLILSAFCDSDWVGDSLDRRSTSGFCVFLGSNLISWCAKKQPTVARSSTEAEYRALAITASELIWLRRLLRELDISVDSPTDIYCDNISAIALTSNPVFHARTKHIEVDYHFIREKVLSKELHIAHVSSADQPADIFTKSLTARRHSLLYSKLKVSSLPSA
ncbi:uncharacterized mitochondrial protein AtMg00810-like [Phoenix dactylifera]|uniref:Uncharacterized mitochondrial protein AtMg00810-like n=1 Tax=Phoenix dactylifera TaxID=42345 RepID=A0A8B9ANV3_PHODC|nr:uncharacterized mitochondrial protein AtMg00810-like [Phoenix dactylifera]